MQILRQQTAQKLRSLRPLNGQEHILIIHALNLDVVATNALAQRRVHIFSGCGILHQHEFVTTETVNDEVINNAAVFLHNHGVLGTAQRQRLDCRDQGVCKKRRRILTSDADNTHQRQVENTNGLTHCVVLCNFRRIAERHFVATNIAHFCAKAYVLIMQGATERIVVLRSARIVSHTHSNYCGGANQIVTFPPYI